MPGLFGVCVFDVMMRGDGTTTPAAHPVSVSAYPPHLMALPSVNLMEWTMFVLHTDSHTHTHTQVHTATWTKGCHTFDRRVTCVFTLTRAQKRALACARMLCTRNPLHYLKCSARARNAIMYIMCRLFSGNTHTHSHVDLSAVPSRKVITIYV